MDKCDECLRQEAQPPNATHAASTLKHRHLMHAQIAERNSSAPRSEASNRDSREEVGDSRYFLVSGAGIVLKDRRGLCFLFCELCK